MSERWEYNPQNIHAAAWFYSQPWVSRDGCHGDDPCPYCVAFGDAETAIAKAQKR